MLDLNAYSATSISEIVGLDAKSTIVISFSAEIFESFHSCSWEEKHQITSKFSLLKRKQFFHEIDDENKFDVIYFDAFGNFKNYVQTHCPNVFKRGW
mgnify:CR=1 FL=1